MSDSSTLSYTGGALSGGVELSPVRGVVLAGSVRTTGRLRGARHGDVLSEEGRTKVLDLRKFHEIEETSPTPTFPYPASAA